MNFREHRAKVRADVMFQEVSGELVLLDLNSESYFGLDAVGTRIWQLIAEDGNLQRVFECMLTEYAVEPEKLEQDLTELVTGLRDNGLIEIVGLED